MYQMIHEHLRYTLTIRYVSYDTYRVLYDTNNYDYANWALRGAEERYPSKEKLAFALVTATCKLKPYFQAHTVIVLTDKPLWQVMSNPEDAERMALWAIKLSEFDIQYRLRTAIKGQVVADFIVEFTNMEC